MWCTSCACHAARPVAASSATSELPNRFCPGRSPPKKSYEGEPIGRKRARGPHRRSSRTTRWHPCDAATRRRTTCRARARRDAAPCGSATAPARCARRRRHIAGGAARSAFGDETADDHEVAPDRRGRRDRIGLARADVDPGAQIEHTARAEGGAWPVRSRHRVPPGARHKCRRRWCARLGHRCRPQRNATMRFIAACLAPACGSYRHSSRPLSPSMAITMLDGVVTYTRPSAYTGRVWTPGTWPVGVGPGRR